METLKETGIPDSFITIAMECISTTSMQVIWNGEKMEPFFQSTGVRQGDPLSPYIFILCMERLAHIINVKVDMGKWKPMRLKKDGLVLSHLFFTEDRMLFVEADLDYVCTIRKCLKKFDDSSGQKISLTKTVIYCLKSIFTYMERSYSKEFGCKLTYDLGKYLGVPFWHNRVSKHTHAHVVEKVDERLAG